MINRREFSIGGVVAAGAASGMAVPSAWAQFKAPIENEDYKVLSPPAPTDAPAGKIEVIEFFWYGCPHCHSFEPDLAAWSKRLPKDVQLRRSPVAFQGSLEPHQRIYFALEALNLLDKLHARVFQAIHVDKQRLLAEDEILKWMVGQGVDGAAFSAQYRAFAVQSKVQRANQLANSLYKIDGVPALGIGGRYLTSPSVAGTKVRALQVTDYLLDQLRKKR